MNEQILTAKQAAENVSIGNLNKWPPLFVCSSTLSRRTNTPACKMDADRIIARSRTSSRMRENSLDLGERRWSMSPHTICDIVAAIMRPVSHVVRCFDRDDSKLLEDYLTAAGIIALDAVEAGEEPPQPNYAEVGLVLQGLAENYSKKVDHIFHLGQNVNLMLKGIDTEADEGSGHADSSPESASRAPRARAASAPPRAPGFQLIELRAGAAAQLGAPPRRPPPTLPRRYAELQPRAAAPELALLDYAGEPIGSLDDFRAMRSLQDGFLVGEFEWGVRAGGATLPPLSVLELQEACERAAPAPLSPGAPPAPLSPAAPPSPGAPAAATPAPAALSRKRRSEVRIEDLLIGSLNMAIDRAAVARLGAAEFSLPERWVARVVRHRRDVILRARQSAPAASTDFRGYDYSWMDIGGLRGWSAGEAREAAAEARRECALLAAALARSRSRSRSPGTGDYDWMSGDYSDQVQQAAGSAGAGEEPVLDLQALARHVRRALPPPPAALSWRRLAAAARRDQPLPSRVLLDVLMKASTGEVEIEHGEPLCIGDFTVRLRAERAPAGREVEEEPPPSPPPPELEPRPEPGPAP